MYLLDTNHVSKLLDGHPELIHRLELIENACVCSCVIVQGELRFMVERSGRRESNRERLQAFLRDVDVLELSADVADVYGELKSAVVAHFSPKHRLLRRGTKLHHLGFSDNDLWIAAIAVHNDLTVVSQDSDFARIAEAYPALKWEDWLTKR